MPAIAFPALLPASVDVFRVAAQGIQRDPFTAGPLVADADARAWRIVVRMQILDATDAALMLAWLEELDGCAGTFLFDLDPWWRGTGDNAPGEVEFRLLPDQTQWANADPRVVWEVTFEAQEEPASA